MSVLIKGITLEQFYRDLNNVRDMDVGWDVVQLPPHGRLIDADDVFHVLTSYYHHSTDFQHEALKEALARVSTIILAEEGKDG